MQKMGRGIRPCSILSCDDDDRGNRENAERNPDIAMRRISG